MGALFLSSVTDWHETPQEDEGEQTANRLAEVSQKSFVHMKKYVIAEENA